MSMRKGKERWDPPRLPRKLAMLAAKSEVARQATTFRWAQLTKRHQTRNLGQVHYSKREEHPLQQTMKQKTSSPLRWGPAVSFLR